MLARLLQIQSVEVAVYEREWDRHARIQGSALDLHTESGLAALKAAGLMEGFWARVRHDLDRLRIADPCAVILYDFVRGKGSGVERPEIERGPLRELLLDSLHPDTVRWNKKLEGAALQGGQVHLKFEDGETVVADLAIGADGANSRLRSLVTPIRPEYAGVTLVEGLVPSAETAVPQIWHMLEGSALFALGNEQTLAIATKSDGSLLFYAGLKAPSHQIQKLLTQAKSSDERVAWFRTFFPQWDPIWDPLFMHAQQLVWRPQQVCPPTQRWDARAEVTLLGDAAHVMPPYAGEGVNMAMLDALVLSRHLAQHSDRKDAIAAYEQEMFERMAHVASMTMANTERFYSPDAAAQIVSMFRSFARQAAAEASPISDLPN